MTALNHHCTSLDATAPYGEGKAEERSFSLDQWRTRLDYAHLRRSGRSRRSTRWSSRGRRGDIEQEEDLEEDPEEDAGDGAVEDAEGDIEQE